MRILVTGIVLAASGWAQSPPGSQASSIEQQRAAVLTQIGSVTGKAATPPSAFFTVPWVEAPPARNFAVSGITPPPCNALASDELDKLIEQNAQQEGVKADLIRAVISQESGARPCAVSSKGAQGLMQLMPATAAQFNVSDPFDPKQNVEAGTRLLKQLLAKYNGDVSLALSAYNAGSARVDQQGGVPDIAETMQYVASILAKLPKR
jgi:soluble lytic murein transglycosylase-like protein